MERLAARSDPAVRLALESTDLLIDGPYVRRSPTARANGEDRGTSESFPIRPWHSPLAAAATSFSSDNSVLARAGKDQRRPTTRSVPNAPALTESAQWHGPGRSGTLLGTFRARPTGRVGVRTSLNRRAWSLLTKGELPMPSNITFYGTERESLELAHVAARTNTRDSTNYSGERGPHALSGQTDSPRLGLNPNPWTK